MSDLLPKALSNRVTIRELLAEARGLREPGEDDVNPEYDRGMCELIARVLPIGYPDGLETPEMALIVAKKIGIKRNLYD